VLYGKGITNDYPFVERVLSGLRQFMEDDGQSSIYQRFIAPSSSAVRFATALNRSVTASMNDLIGHAISWLVGIPRHCSTRPWLPAERHSVVGNRSEQVGQVRKAERGI
jgi:hypothetical protein